MHVNSTPFGVRQAFIQSLPYRPHAGTRKDRLRKVWASEALHLPHIQSDRPTLTTWMKFDVDFQERGGKLIRGRRETGARWQDVELPRPHFIVRHKSKDSCHYYYLLHTPLVTGPNARALPQRLFTQVASAMTYLLDADFGYTGFSAKNPLSSAWHTDVWEGEPYELNDLKEALPYSLQAFPSTEALGVGRNCHLFGVVLAWGYAEIADTRGGLTPERWAEIVRLQAHSLNRYAPKLPRSEVDGIAKRCAAYTWKGFQRRYKGDVAKLKRGQRLSHLRDTPPLEGEELRARQVESALITAAKKRNKRDDAILEAIGSLIARGVLNPTNAQICELSGVSERTLRRWRASQGMGAGN